MSDLPDEKQIASEFLRRGIPLRQIVQTLWIIFRSFSSHIRSSLLISMAIHSWVLSAIFFLDPNIYQEAGRPLVEFITGLPPAIFGAFAIFYLITHRKRHTGAWASLWPVLLVSIPVPLILLATQPMLQLSDSLFSTILSLLILCRSVVYTTHLIRYGALNNITILAICTSFVVVMDGALLFYSYERFANPDVRSIGDAFWMCFQAISASGWSCPPVTTGGRITAVIVWITGFGTLTSVVTSSVSFLVRNLPSVPKGVPPEHTPKN